MVEDLIIQRPAGPAQQLVLLYHGVGGSPADMQALGRRLAAEFESAFVVSIAAPEAFEVGFGRQWFSMRDITEENRSQRVAGAMPVFLERVGAWQREAGVGVEATALIGFSQGAIMALEATLARDPLAGRVVAIAGRYARLPRIASASVTVHFIHGKSDPVIAYRHTIEAAERLIALGGDVTADVLPFVEHELNAQIIDLVIERLRGYLPRRRWEEALRSAPED
jgi:phospholipase/carboxylesterase